MHYSSSHDSFQCLLEQSSALNVAVEWLTLISHTQGAYPASEPGLEIECLDLRIVKSWDRTGLIPFTNLSIVDKLPTTRRYVNNKCE
jgi:hypothetical protein